MKKFLCIFILISFLVINTTACTKNGTKKANMIQSKRRFAEFVEPSNHNPNTIDLSEGPRLKYDATLGPGNLNFDIKIVDPYKNY